MSQNVSRNNEREQQAALKDKFLSIAYQAEFSRRDALKGLFGVAAAAVLLVLEGMFFGYGMSNMSEQR